MGILRGEPALAVLGVIVGAGRAGFACMKFWMSCLGSGAGVTIGLGAGFIMGRLPPAVDRLVAWGWVIGVVDTGCVCMADWGVTGGVGCGEGCAAGKAGAACAIGCGVTAGVVGRGVVLGAGWASAVTVGVSCRTIAGDCAGVAVVLLVGAAAEFSVAVL